MSKYILYRAFCSLPEYVEIFIVIFIFIGLGGKRDRSTDGNICLALWVVNPLMGFFFFLRLLLKRSFIVFGFFCGGGGIIQCFLPP